METAFAQPAKQVLRANWLPFLSHCIAAWPVTTEAVSLIAAFRSMVAQTPHITDVEVAEIEALLERTPETPEDNRLKSLLSFACNFVWLEADNPFLSTEESSSPSEHSSHSGEEEGEVKSSTDYGDSPRSASSDSGDDEDEDGEDERLFFIKEIVLCQNTLQPMREIVAKPLLRLFERDQGVTEDNLHLLKNMLKQNVAYLETGQSDSLQQQLLTVDDKTPRKRAKLS